MRERGCRPEVYFDGDKGQQVNYLTHEVSLLQAESRRIDANVAQLTASAAQQDQAATAAVARATAARADAARLNDEGGSLRSQAAAANAQASVLDQQIAQHMQNQPDKTIEIADGKFRPNPAWTTWKAQLDSLTAQRDQARSTAASLSAQVGQRSAAAAQAQSSAAVADSQAAAARASASQLRQQAAQAGARKTAVTQQAATITRWQQEITRPALDRSALEATARELAGQIAVLENEYQTLNDQANAAEQKQWYLQTLLNEVSRKIADLNGQLGPAATEVANAAAAVTDLQTRIQHVMQRVPE